MSNFEFNLTKFQTEYSQDSNSQLEHINYKNGILSFISEWDGYHPQGGAGRMPSSNYQLSDSKITELKTYIEKNELNSEYNEDLKDKATSSMLPESQSYGYRLKITKDNKSFNVVSSYSTSGPRDPELEKKPIYEKLDNFFKHLESLPRTEGVSEKILSTEEREEEIFFNLKGYKKNEKPKFVSNMSYSLEMQKTKKGKWDHDVTPFLFQYSRGAGDRFYVVLRDATTITRTEYQGKPEFFEKLASLLVQFNLHEVPKSNNYEYAGLPFGEFILKHNFEVGFNNVSNWAFKFSFSHFSSPEIRQKNSGPESLIVRIDKFSEGLKELLKSKLVTTL